MPQWLLPLNFCFCLARWPWNCFSDIFLEVLKPDAQHPFLRESNNRRLVTWNGIKLIKINELLGRSGSLWNSPLFHKTETRSSEVDSNHDSISEIYNVANVKGDAASGLNSSAALHRLYLTFFCSSSSGYSEAILKTELWFLYSTILRNNETEAYTQLHWDLPPCLECCSSAMGVTAGGPERDGWYQAFPFSKDKCVALLRWDRKTGIIYVAQKAELPSEMLSWSAAAVAHVLENSADDSTSMINETRFIYHVSQSAAWTRSLTEPLWWSRICLSHKCFLVTKERWHTNVQGSLL